MEETAWYKHRWPWVLISIPFIAVVWGMFMITVVVLHPDDVVDDNYYQDGMAINQRLDMDRNARHLHIHAKLLSYSPKRIALAVDGARDSALVLKFSHITDESKDRKIILYPEHGNVYATTRNVPGELRFPGVWYVDLIGPDGDWRLRTRISTPLNHMELIPK